MSQISLTDSFFRDYTGPHGQEAYEQDQKIIQHVLDIGSKDYGYKRFEVGEVGYLSYPYIEIVYDGVLVYKAQKISTGEWWVSFSKLSLFDERWPYIFKK